jgi:hypothetical protein
MGCIHLELAEKAKGPRCSAPMEIKILMARTNAMLNTDRRERYLEQTTTPFSLLQRVEVEKSISATPFYYL